jgi:hypothetical protein
LFEKWPLKNKKKFKTKKNLTNNIPSLYFLFFGFKKKFTKIQKYWHQKRKHHFPGPTLYRRMVYAIECLATIQPTSNLYKN